MFYLNNCGYYCTKYPRPRSSRRRVESFIMRPFESLWMGRSTRMLLLIALLCVVLQKSSHGLVTRDEVLALEAIFDSTNGSTWAWRPTPLGIGTPWFFADYCLIAQYDPACDPCDGNWQGIKCHYVAPAGVAPLCGGGPTRVFSGPQVYCVDTFVTHIDLNGYNMQGALPNVFNAIPKLRQLDLDNNFVRGAIPPSLFSLAGIENVSFASNAFSGTLPYLGNTSTLQVLRLSNNKVRGSLPSEVGSLSNLAILLLGYNSFNGRIPSSLFDGTSISALDMNFNRLTGPLPTQIAQMVRLRTFSVLFNSLSGTIPTILGAMSNMLDLSLRNNFFTGLVPTELIGMKALNRIDFAFNCLKGTIPSELGLMTALRSLELGGNSFHGPFPIALTNLSDLGHLGLENNLFTGTIPSEIGSLFNLSSIELDENTFSGPLPEAIVLISGLKTIDFSNNSFTGTIPTVWGRLTSLENLEISENYLHGSIPMELLNCNRLNVLSVHQNCLGGTLPSALGTAFPQLVMLDLGENSFSGTVPDIWNMTRLRVLYLDLNKFSGPISSDIGRLVNLVNINLGINSFTGTIPNSIGNLTDLQGLLLDGNQLKGTIPTSIGHLSRLQVLALSQNCLSGTLPPLTSLGELVNITVQRNRLRGRLDSVFSEVQTRLEIVDVADNAFTGTLPLSLFNHSKLRSLSASINCFEGYIRNRICELAPSLEELVLDGLTSGSACVEKIGIFFKIRVLKDNIPGTIPGCLFSLKNFTKLHASSNGIAGTLPNIPVGSKLKNIALAWNNLEGTIPLSYETVEFNTLDLAVNKISGEVPLIRINQLSPDNSLSLNNNRLSGPIPSIFRDMLSINMLTGNMFECSTDRRELPVNDRNYAQYTCGSDSMSDALMFWTICITATVLVLSIILYRSLRKPGVSTASRLSGWLAITGRITRGFLGLRDDFLSQRPELPIFFPRLVYFYRMYCHLRRLVVMVTAAVVFIYFPVYVVIYRTTPDTKSAAWNSIYTNQYLWAYSGVWSSGIGYASVMFALWVCVLAFVAYVMYPEVRLQLKSRFELRLAANARLSSVADPVMLENPMLPSTSMAASKTSVNYFASSTDNLDSLPMHVFQRKTTTVALHSNRAVAPTRSREWRLTAAEILLVCVNIAVMIGANAGFIVGMQSSQDESTKLVLQFLILPSFNALWGRFQDLCILLMFSGSEHSPYRLYYSVLVFNIIFAPFVSSIFIDSSCLLYVFDEPNKLTTETTFEICSEWTTIFGQTLCTGFAESNFTTDFVPSYPYHNTCSHSIISRFIPPLLVFYFINCFLVPAVKYRMFFGSSGDIFERIYNRLPSWCRDIVPKYLLSPEVNEQSYNKFPSARMLATSHVNLTVLLTFGLVFPPLAVIIALLVLVQSWLHLEMIKASLNAWYAHKASDLSLQDDVTRSTVKEISNNASSDFSSSSSSSSSSSGRVFGPSKSFIPPLDTNMPTGGHNRSYSGNSSSSSKLASVSSGEVAMVSMDGTESNKIVSEGATKSTASINSRTSSSSTGSTLTTLSLRSRSSRCFDVDPTVLDIYLSADCTGYLACNVIMCITSALFFTMLLSDMLSDEIGVSDTRPYWGTCVFVIFAILGIYVYLLHRYMTRPRVVQSTLPYDRWTTSSNNSNSCLYSCVNHLRAWLDSMYDAMGFLWDMCFGNGAAVDAERCSAWQAARPSAASLVTISNSNNNSNNAPNAYAAKKAAHVHDEL